LCVLQLETSSGKSVLGEEMRLVNNVDTYELLARTHILIADYSSVYFDFLLTEKPIIFAPFDYENYIKNDREFYYDYDEVTPGPKCKDWDDVLDWIAKFTKNPSLFLQERIAMKNRFHQYQDGQNCKRVYEKITELVEVKK